MSRKDRFRQSRTPARDAAERIERVVEAAERAAETVIDDAEKRATAYLADTQAEADRVVSQRLASLSELSDTLRAQAEAIGRQAEGLLATMERVKAELGADATELQVLGDPPHERTSHLTAVAEPEDQEPEPEPQPAPGRGSPAGARLLATQMAVSGNSREEIELRLRNGFEIDDTTAILDAILGPEE